MAPSKAEGVSSVTLAEITGVAGWKNTGWTADVATKVGTTDKAAGAHLDNGATVTLLENTTFTAEWAQLYTVTYNKAGGEGGKGTTDMKDYTKSVDFGLGLGLTYNIAKDVFVQGRYTMGLTKVFDGPEGKNGNAQIAIGYRF